MRPLQFDGFYQDAVGRESITWRIGSSWTESYEITTRIRGADVIGMDFDSLALVTSSESFSISSWGDLTDCTLGGWLPVTVTDADAAHLDFQVDLTDHHEPIAARLVADDTSYAHAGDGHFELALGPLAESLLPRRWECCLTCGLSDYSPGGQGLSGIRCHRDARAQYLAVRGKSDYWTVPVTEVVPEFYRCESHEVRRPGTGYRG